MTASTSIGTAARAEDLYAAIEERRSCLDDLKSLGAGEETRAGRAVERQP